MTNTSNIQGTDGGSFTVVLPITDFRDVLTMHDPEAGYRQVYFMYCAGFIKIGTARSIIRRAAELQIGSPWKSQIVLLIPGGRLRESFLHFAFRDHHFSGEWFHLSPVIREAIRELAPSECIQWLAEEEESYREWVREEADRLGLI
jgi:hypothetical protein